MAYLEPLFDQAQEGSILRTHFALCPQFRRPHIFKRGGWWRVSEMPKSDDSGSLINGHVASLWSYAHQWVGEQNNKIKGFK